MNFMRSLVFNLLYTLWMPIIGIVLFIPSMCFARIGSHGVGRTWARGVVILLRVVMGIRYEIKGNEYLQRDGAAVYAVKHLSAWETVMFWIFVDTPVYVLKQELTKLPVFGYYLRNKIACIAIDRSAPAKNIWRQVGRSSSSPKEPAVKLATHPIIMAASQRSIAALKSLLSLWHITQAFFGGAMPL
jgi:1-acyl-sn-glycerol-3-phosphate acyltransferase